MPRPKKSSPQRRSGPLRPKQNRRAPEAIDIQSAADAADGVNGPQKIHKVLAQAGLGSRREMETLIREGKVRVNGEPALVGMRVRSGDVIRVGRRQVTVRDDAKLPRVILYHKPEGEIVSHDDPQGRPTVFEKLPAMRRGKWLAIGRLDYNTSGLLIFTTSGELANRLMHPRYEVEREYAVRIIGKLPDDKIKDLTKGVRLEDGMARFEELEERGGRGLNNWYRVVLREGRNRVVRRMFDAVGFKVSRLMRVRFGMVSLPFGLRRGGWRELEDDQTSQIMDWSEKLVHPELAEAAEVPAARPEAQRSPGTPAQPRPPAKRVGKAPTKGPRKGPRIRTGKDPVKNPESVPGKGRPPAGKGRFSPAVGRAREEKPDRRPRSSRAR